MFWRNKSVFLYKIGRGFITGFYLMLLSSTALSESVYVTDILHLGMYEAPGSGSKVETLITGARLTVLEKTRKYIKVRTSSGNIGWAKAAYLVKEKPARLLVDQLMKKNQGLTDKLESEIKKTKGERKRLFELQQQSKLAIEDSNKQADRLTQLEKENVQFKKYMATYSTSIPFSVFMPAIILCLIAGFIACYFWIDYQSRKRHGGFRIR